MNKQTSFPADAPKPTQPVFAWLDRLLARATLAAAAVAVLFSLSAISESATATAPSPAVKAVRN